MSFITPYSSNSLKKIGKLSSLDFSLSDHSIYNNLSWDINVRGDVSDDSHSFPSFGQKWMFLFQRFVVMWFSETANRWFS